MFSDELMRFIMNYQVDEQQPKTVSTVREIKFKDSNSAKLAEVLITLNK